MLRAVCAAALMACAGYGWAETSLTVGYLKIERPDAVTLSNLDPVPEDLGLAGAALGLTDNQTTGRFLGQSFALGVTHVGGADDLAEAARAALADAQAVIVDAPRDVVLQIADMPEAANAILFNVAARDSDLRGAACRGNLFHTIPSHAMLADALSQFLVTRRWDKTAMIAGARDEDRAIAAAYEASLVKFGMKPGARADWTFDADMRRSASAEVPLFTQGLGTYDVLLIADAVNDFARYVAYNTWHPRPIAGSEGLRPLAWARVVEQWGAAQLQSRFTDAAGRDMLPEDYAAWAAMRALGEAVTRTGADDVTSLRDYLLSEDFELAGFKGRPLSFRAWNGQLRQPIPLVTRSAVVATAPLEGFLHQHNELDTLGLDRPDSDCTAF